MDGSFTVVVADNSRYMDETENYTHGTFETLEAALDAARKIVNVFLLTNFKPEMSATQLYDAYVAFGEDPFVISPNSGRVAFSAWEYAKLRCAEICGKQQ